MRIPSTFVCNDGKGKMIIIDNVPKRLAKLYAKRYDIDLKHVNLYFINRFDDMPTFLEEHGFDVKANAY